MNSNIKDEKEVKDTLLSVLNSAIVKSSQEQEEKIKRYKIDIDYKNKYSHLWSKEKNCQCGGFQNHCYCDFWEYME